jgi:hypothetical protein
MKVVLEFTESQLSLLCRISAEKGKTLEQLIALSVCKFIESEQTSSIATDTTTSPAVSQVLASSTPSSMFQISANPRSFCTPVVPQDSSEDVVEEEVAEEITEFDSEEDMKSVEEFLF